MKFAVQAPRDSDVRERAHTMHLTAQTEAEERWLSRLYYGRDATIDLFGQILDELEALAIDTAGAVEGERFSGLADELRELLSIDALRGSR